MEPYSRRVYYYETDTMNICHNANYLRIFEEARLDFMRKQGVSYKMLEDKGIVIPQVEAHVKYEIPMEYDDFFEVTVKVEKCDGIKITYSYEIMLPEKGKRAATGWTTHCFLDGLKRIPVSIKRRMPEVFEKMK